MFYDLTLEITPKMVADAQGNEKKALVGHLGTHFDAMDKPFPLQYARLPGVAFDVRAAARGAEKRDITAADIDLARVRTGMFVAFYTGFMEDEGYGGKTYFTAHPQLADGLIDALLDAGALIIGIDCAGVRRGREHTPKDQYCADRGAFVVENLCGLGAVVNGAKAAAFTAFTFPMRYAGMTGLPCRVVAEV